MTADVGGLVHRTLKLRDFVRHDPEAVALTFAHARSDEIVEVDLQNALTHELGHLLGWSVEGAGEQVLRESAEAVLDEGRRVDSSVAWASSYRSERIGHMTA